MDTIITTGTKGIVIGDKIQFASIVPWWKRLWRRITRYKEPIFVVTSVSDTDLKIYPGYGGVVK